jgi:putative salt-induced outer membrane protein
MQKKLALGIVILLCTQTGFADEGFSGEGSLGLTYNTGNTETQDLNAGLSVGYSHAKWDHKAKLEALQSEENDNKTAERYGLQLQSDYKLLSENDSLFGTIRYEDDQFSSYEYQASLVGGYGHYFINTEPTKLKVEIGAGVRQSKLKDSTGSAGAEFSGDEVLELTFKGEENTEAIVHLGLEFSHQLSEQATFTQHLLVEGGKENIYTKSLTALDVKLMGNLALRLALEIRNNSDVNPGMEKTDTTTTMNLVYNF